MTCASDATVAAIAAHVGYQSESAFSRALRAEVGATPARFRRDQQQRGRVSIAATARPVIDVPCCSRRLERVSAPPDQREPVVRCTLREAGGQ
jgi:AraC-like DNA-binding protein